LSTAPNQESLDSKASIPKFSVSRKKEKKGENKC
jgi:hypothetical protein